MRLLFNIHFILLGTLFLYSCESKNVGEADSKQSKKSKATRVVEVQSLQPSKEIVLPGELKAWDRVELHPRVRGFIKTVNVDRGTKVKKGQLLAVVEAPDVLEEFHNASAQWQSSLATLEENKAKYNLSNNGYIRLLKTNKTAGAISEHELDQAKSRMLADSAIVLRSKENVRAAEANYSGKKELVEYLKVTAPFDGVIVERNISAGALVGPGSNQQKPLFILENSAKLRLTIAVPEVYSTAIDPDSKVSFSVNSIPDKKFKGAFARSAENIDLNTRVMMTEFDVPNDSYTLKAGMYAEVKIPIKRSSSTFFVPTKSVVSSSEKVFVIKSNSGIAQWVPVKKGNVLDSLVEVFGDIQNGDKIVLIASEEIRDGLEIK